MPAQLVALDEGPSILLDKPILLLGRHPECDIQIESRKVSRRHCCVAQVSDYLVVRDLGSTNGIRINGLRVLEGRLTAGDELTIGNFRYKVAWDAVAAAAPPLSPQALASGGRDLSSPSPAPKKTFREPTPPEGFDDDLLEGCEEPMPLDEPASPSPAGKERPILRPDPLELMNNNDLFGKNASPPSSAHPS
ncbi:MAG: FHA domain-containing protein [Gemmataceae bacterium]